MREEGTPPANAGGVREAVQSLGREDSLEKGMVTHFSTVAWRLPQTEEPGGYSPWDTTEATQHSCTQVLSLSLLPRLQNPVC